MTNLTLRSRLLAGMAFVALVLVGVSIVVTSVTRAQLVDQVDSRLRAAAPAGFGPGPFADGGGDTPGKPPTGGNPSRQDERVSDLYQGVVTSSGELVTLFTPNFGGEASPPPDLSGVDLSGAGLGGRAAHFVTVGSVDGGDVTYRVLIHRPGDVVTVTATPIDDVEATIHQLVVMQALGSLAILAALGLVGWWVVHLGIRPVKQMTEVASRIADGELGDRVPVHGPGTRPGTESGALANALNRMLERIETAMAERAESEARLRRFVADASHELRTPVTTIRGYAELYRHGGLASGAELDDAMRRTEQEAARIGRLVDDMLVLARLDEERPLAAEPVDLVRLVTDACHDAQAVAPQRLIDVTIDPRLAGATATVTGDEDHLRQVLANVVANALVHTDADVAIHLRLRALDGAYVVDVADEGAGMSADVAERATERFFRADPARSRHRGGSGLGLSIVDATVAAHGGDVTIDSTPGVGTTVHLSFPAA